MEEVKFNKIDKEDLTFRTNLKFWAKVWRQFKKNRLALISMYLILFLMLIAIFADFIANEKPIVAKYKGEQ